MWFSPDMLLAHWAVGAQAMGLFLLLQLLFALLIGPTWLISYRGLRTLNARHRTPLPLQHLQGLLAWGILAVYLPVQRERRMSGMRLLTASSALAVAVIGSAVRPDLQLALWIYTACLGLLASQPRLFANTVNRLTGSH